MVFGFKDWPSFLRHVLNERKESNKRYSLRAFAKSLGVSPGFLSHLMQGKKALSPEAALKIAKALKLSDSECEYLSLLAQFQVASSGQLQQQIATQITKLSRLHEPQVSDTDNFAFIKDWYHIAILEMTYLDEFEFTPKRVAHRLGIPQIQVEVAIDRLIRLGLLLKKPDGSLMKTDTHCVFRTSRRNEAFAYFHQKMIALAMESVEKSEFDKRVIMSHTFCIDETQIEEARQMSRDYIQKMASLFDRAPRKEQTYQLNVQFFSLSDSRLKPALLQD